jgi:hypothetical protein
MTAPVLTSLARAILHQIKRTDPQVAAYLATECRNSEDTRHQREASYVIAELLSSRLDDLMRVTLKTSRPTTPHPTAVTQPLPTNRRPISAPSRCLDIGSHSRWPVGAKALRRVACVYAQQIVAACRPVGASSAEKSAPYELVMSWSLNPAELGQLRAAVSDVDVRVTQMRKIPQTGGAPITKATTRSALRVLLIFMIRNVVCRILANSQQLQDTRRGRKKVIAKSTSLAACAVPSSAAILLARVLNKLLQSEAFWTKKVCCYDGFFAPLVQF